MNEDYLTFWKGLYQRGSAESSVKNMKKLQVKYEHFDLISKTYKLVRQKEGRASRFIDFYTEDTILFKDIRSKVENLEL